MTPAPQAGGEQFNMIIPTPSLGAVLLTIAIIGATCHLILLVIEAWHQWHIGGAIYHLIVLLIELLHRQRR